MNKEQAIQSIKLIQHGSGLNKDHFPEAWRGEIAKSIWNTGQFNYGMEYGYILGMIDAFNLTEDDLLTWQRKESPSPAAD